MVAEIVLCSNLLHKFRGFTATLRRATMTILFSLVVNILFERFGINALQSACAFAYAFPCFFRVIGCPGILFRAHLSSLLQEV
jgi:hypothetical protein